MSTSLISPVLMLLLSTPARRTENEQTEDASTLAAFTMISPADEGTLFSLYRILVVMFLFFQHHARNDARARNKHPRPRLLMPATGKKPWVCVSYIGPIVLLTNNLHMHHKRQNYCLTVIIFTPEVVPNIYYLPLSLHKSKLYYLQSSPPWNW